jgi:hypothetical protein
VIARAAAGSPPVACGTRATAPQVETPARLLYVKDGWQVRLRRPDAIALLVSSGRRRMRATGATSCDRGRAMSESSTRGITLAGAIAALRRGFAAYLLLIVFVSLAGLVQSLGR